MSGGDCAWPNRQTPGKFYPDLLRSSVYYFTVAGSARRVLSTWPGHSMNPVQDWRMRQAGRHDGPFPGSPWPARRGTFQAPEARVPAIQNHRGPRPPHSAFARVFRPPQRQPPGSAVVESRRQGKNAAPRCARPEIGGKSGVDRSNAWIGNDSRTVRPSPQGPANSS